MTKLPTISEYGQCRIRCFGAILPILHSVFWDIGASVWRFRCPGMPKSAVALPLEARIPVPSADYVIKACFGAPDFGIRGSYLGTIDIYALGRK